VTGKKSQFFREELASARGLRRRPTEAENRLWRLLRARRFEGAKFRRQHPVGAYVVDFFCADSKLVIELDGGGHGLEEQAKEDLHRTREVERLGFRVMRVWNTDLMRNPEGVLQRITEALSTPSP
jgi:very-short-patch-repair endonuclease